MNGALRSLKLCEVVRVGTDGWRKQRLRRAWWMIPAGNLLLWLLGVDYRMAWNRWAKHEATTFRKAHPEFPSPRVLSRAVLWLPDIPGRTFPELSPDELEVAALSAFAELGRFHRLEGAPTHGDPHAGNFLYDGSEGRCRIIDFETGRAKGRRPHSRAFDFAILMLDLRKRYPSLATNERIACWFLAYDRHEDRLAMQEWLRRPGLRMKIYLHLLGHHGASEISQSGL